MDIYQNKEEDNQLRGYWQKLHSRAHLRDKIRKKISQKYNVPHLDVTRNLGSNLIVKNIACLITSLLLKKMVCK